MTNNVKVNELKSKIMILRNKLTKTDYKAIKYAEGEITASEYAPILEQRRQWRTEINAYETMLARLNGNG